MLLKIIWTALKKITLSTAILIIYLQTFLGIDITLQSERAEIQVLTYHRIVHN